MTKSSEKKRVVRSAKVGCPKSKKDHFDEDPRYPREHCQSIVQATVKRKQETNTCWKQQG